MIIQLIYWKSISGAGPGGLTCALTLSKYPDIEVDLYEAGARLAENGAGVGIWLRTWKILQQLGLDHDLARVAGTHPSDDPSEFLVSRSRTLCIVSARANLKRYI